MLIGKAVVRGVPKVHVHPPLGLKRPPDPSPNNFAPPISNSWLRPCLRIINTRCFGSETESLHKRINNTRECKLYKFYVPPK